MKTSPADLVIATLTGWSARWPDDRPVTLIDLGSHTDALIDDLRARAQRHAVPIEITRLTQRPADAVEALGAGSFDYAHVGESLEHEKPIVRLTTLRVAERLGRQGLLWSGLVRPPLGGAGFGRKEVITMRKRLSMDWLHGRLPRLGGEFLLAGEFADAWTGLGVTES